MKKLILLGILLFPLLNVYSQTKKELRQQKKLEQYNEAKNMLESKQFEFVANKALPQDGGSIDLTTNPNYLRVNDSIAHSALPFFGRAYNVAYGSKGGIKFNGEMLDYSIQENPKKLSLVLSFRVKGENDSFDCIFTLSSKSSVTLSVTSQQRASISYYGKLQELEADKK